MTSPLPVINAASSEARKTMPLVHESRAGVAHAPPLLSGRAAARSKTNDVGRRINVEERDPSERVGIVADVARIRALQHRDGCVVVHRDARIGTGRRPTFFLPRPL